MMKTVFAIGMVMALANASQSCVAGTVNRPETISGTIRIVGNEPFTQVIIRPASRSGANLKSQDTLITGPLAEELRSDFQGKAVTLEGNECTSPTSRFSKCFRPTKIIVE